jgi:hypothetical protein
VPDEPMLRVEVEVVLPLSHWMAVHGALHVATRHPGVPDMMRAALLDVAASLERMFLATGFLRPSELEEIRRVWADARDSDRDARRETGDGA